MFICSGDKTGYVIIDTKTSTLTEERLVRGNRNVMVVRTTCLSKQRRISWGRPNNVGTSGRDIVINSTIRIT